ncbi:MAG: tetratricopeptide repeat-containing sulfotransferase family protein [Pseudomonadales bacterium]
MALSPEQMKALEGQLRSGDAAGALAAAEAALAQQPEGELHYFAAVAARYAGDFNRAQGHLDALKRLQPDFGRAYQEQGHLLRLRGDGAGALAAYERACALNPALRASFTQRIALAKAQGDSAHGALAEAQLAALDALPQPLQIVVSLLSEGKLRAAEQHCRRFLKGAPKHAEGMRLLADIAQRLGELADAEFLLESVLAFEPNHVTARIDYLRVLRKRQKFEAARAEAAKLLATAPDNPQYQSIYAIECMQCGDYDTALETFDAVLKALPEDGATLTAKGHALKTLGQQDAAIAAYKSARGKAAEAYYALANLKTYRFEDALIEEMRAKVEDLDLGHMDRVHLHFALGKALEDQGEAEAAFGHYLSGNGLKRAQSRYSAARMHEDLKATATVCDGDFFEQVAGAGYDAPDPIFIVGLPRAGSTLLEQILASHSAIDGTLELPHVVALAQRLRRRPQPEGQPFPAILRTLEATDYHAFGKSYLEETVIHRAGAPFFTDKMPNNFRHLGLIKAMLPKAKIIDARRNPLDCCVSGFKQLFAEGQEFSYDLADLGRYYVDYVALMDHWDAVMPGAVLRVQHETLLEDFEGEVRRMLAYLGLPFEDQCLRFHETARSVRTASSEQVRRPLNRDGVGQWKAFEAQLGPLREALKPVLTRSDVGPLT